MDSIHVHYAKGFCVMNALKEYIGADKLNAALRRYVEDTKFQTAPFTTSQEFLKYIRAAVPEDLNYIVRDWFEHITFYDLAVHKAVSKETGGGHYLVKIDYAVKKTYADGQGMETSAPLNDLIPFAVFGEGGRVLHYEKHRISAESGTLEITVNDIPVRVSVDPHMLLMDRDEEDNSASVEPGLPSI